MDPTLHEGLPNKARKSLLQLGDVLRDARAKSQRSAHAALSAILDGTGYLQYATSLGDPEDVAREENIAELVSDVVDFDEKVGEGLAGYLQHVSLLTSADRGDEEGPAVQMMTVHAAKGLEFDHVFLCGLEEGVFPSLRSLEEKDGLEEERRLMYVALTRGRRTVWLGSAKERMVGGVMQNTLPSRFLKEIPADCTEEQKPWHSWSRDEDADATVDAAALLDPGELPSLSPGVRVRHEHFGFGVVRRLDGRGIQARAQVRFDDGVERTLILEYAGLQVLGEEPW
jgi:DNA helicase-2/ATP-dependent DNA helicase PcrA